MIIQNMKNETITGSLVLVHPQAQDDPMKKQGQVGVLTYPRAPDENYVSFPKGGESVYKADDLLMLKPKEEILQELMQRGSEMPINDFKAMYKIMMYQENGTSSSLYNALEVARDHPGIWEKTLKPVDRSEKIELEQEVSR